MNRYHSVKQNNYVFFIHFLGILKQQIIIDEKKDSDPSSV